MSDRTLWYASAKVKGAGGYSVRIYPAYDPIGPRFEEDAPTLADLKRLLLELRPRWAAELEMTAGPGIARADYGVKGETPEQVVAWGLEKVDGTEGFAAFILQNYDFDGLDSIVTTWREGLGASGGREGA